QAIVGKLEDENMKEARANQSGQKHNRDEFVGTLFGQTFYLVRARCPHQAVMHQNVAEQIRQRVPAQPEIIGYPDDERIEVVVDARREIDQHSYLLTMPR